MVYELLLVNIDKTMKNNDGYRPYDIAKLYNLESVQQLFVK